MLLGTITPKIVLLMKYSVQKIGLLVLINHDANDIPLEMGKTLVYRKSKVWVHVWFVVLILSWIVTRLGIYPYYVLTSVFNEATIYIPGDVFPFYSLFKGF